MVEIYKIENNPNLPFCLKGGITHIILEIFRSLRRRNGLETLTFQFPMVSSKMFLLERS